jgi:phosphoribosylformylglycinamidine synthase
VKPLILEGSAAFSDFRIRALMERLTAAAPTPAIERVVANHVYFLHTTGPLNAEQLGRAQSLLGTGTAFDAEHGFFVTPRKGTISPWSSKATDIFHNCGLNTIVRVERGIHFRVFEAGDAEVALADFPAAMLELLHDRMTEGVYADVSDLFRDVIPGPLVEIDVLHGGREALADANTNMGLALSDEEIDYLYDAYLAIHRNPTDVELVMFGQVNSEHCRHKIFNADWVIDGVPRDQSLFDMIRHTHACHPDGTLVAYKDNSGVIEGFADAWFEVNREGRKTYGYVPGTTDMLMKVETHNHPTAISPYPGAATGVGGEIRDESATGIGGKSKAGLAAFMVSNLRVPGFAMPWETAYAPFPDRLASPLDIMIEGPIGGARFGNEFGRPQLCGLFRTYEEMVQARYLGYHKPIMVAGGMGNIKRIHAGKHDIPPGSLIIQLGGPAMRIGLGGGAASSMGTGTNAAELDFDSVQRDNAEMERRCQEVIDACIALGTKNPVLSIHDIGAGGLSNGCPELVAETGGHFRLRNIHNEDLSMSPMEIWCCEAQERYVLAIRPGDLERFIELCERERCPAAVIGEARDDGQLILEDKHFGNRPIDIDIGVILGKPPKMVREVTHLAERHPPLNLDGIRLEEAVQRVLRLPAVADKTFLITIADRSVTGMVARDQMVGPYQTPLADVAVTATSYRSVHGEAMAMGERPAVAILNAPASGRMAVGEALTNIAAADIGAIGKVRLSANWMCACGEPGEDAALFDTVAAVGLELCPELGVSIPVGKDSLSMRTVWTDAAGHDHRMTAPLSLVVSAFATVRDVRRTVTPDLKPGASVLMLLDLGGGRNRLGASALAQVYNQVGTEPPDLDDPALFVRFFNAIQSLIGESLLMAYHDRSDGGLFAAVAEMAFGARRGVRLDLRGSAEGLLPALFAEELGAVLQVACDTLPRIQAVLAEHGLETYASVIGSPADDKTFEIAWNGQPVYREGVIPLNRMWSELTSRMQALRDNPSCAAEAFDALLDETDPGMQMQLTYDPDTAPPFTLSTARPAMAILREQGINGQLEMAAAFDRAGFESVDVHMTDLLAGRVDLAAFQGLVACGGFSYGDVLGAGAGWAKSVLFNEDLKAMFAAFFAREDTFALGVCNGCQMMAQLKDIIPGAEHWPVFVRNRSEQFEARFVTVEIMPSPSIFFRDMAGTRTGIAVAHGEGRADFSRTGSLEHAGETGLLAMRYVDNHGRAADAYPFNPNGSPGGVTGLTTTDGRVTIMMPHPERGFRALQLSYRPAGLFNGEAGPWMRMFENARAFVG